MAGKILVGYASRYGSTEEVAEVVAEQLRESGLDVDLKLLRDSRSVDGYTAFVIGAPLYMFHWHKDALNFLSWQRIILEERPLAIFVLGPVHDPYDEEEWSNSRQQLNRELAQFPWLKPLALEMFGGKYDPEKLGFPLKLFAGKEPASDLRDWDAIRSWATNLAKRLAEAPS
jgi:menaquinone-dependent protoporphyrinogen oxidase